jgi:hypothetical protein
MSGISGKTAGVIQTITDPQGRAAGAWQPIQQAYANVGGSWLTTYLRFTPITHTYFPNDYPTGFPSGNIELVPEHATHLRITVQGGGGAGGATYGGDGGGYAVKDVAIVASDWPSGAGRSLSFGGSGFAGGGDAGDFAAGGDADVGGTLAAGVINMHGGGGAFANNVGGTASGGDTNISGGPGANTGSGGGAGGGGGGYGNGGDRDLNADGFGGNGTQGYWKFEWT